MSLSLIMEVDGQSEKRKEAILLVNNFFVSFCIKHGIYILKTESNNETESLKNIEQLFNILENCAFFEHLELLLLQGDGNDSYYEALSQLLLNLTIAHPHLMREKITKDSNLHSLLSICTPHPPHMTHMGKSSLLEGQSSKLYQLRNNQTRLFTIRNTMQIIRFLIFDSEGVSTHLVTTTQIISHIDISIDLCWAERDCSLHWDLALVVFSVMSDILHLIPSEDLQSVLSHETGTKLFELLEFGTRKKDIESMHVIHILLSKALLLHPDFESILSLKSRINGDELMPSLLKTLCELLLKEEAHSFVYQSAVVSLRCLLAKSQKAKQWAIEGILYLTLASLQTTLEDHLTKSAQNRGKDETTILSVLGLIRHLTAGSVDAKKACGLPAIFKATCLLMRGKIKDEVAQEIALTILNIIVSCDTNKTKVCSSGLVELMCKRLDTDISSSIFSVLRSLANHRDSRAILSKCGILIVLEKSLRRGWSEGIISILVDYSMELDGQLSLMQVPGLLETIFGLIREPDVFILLRNMAAPRENKCYFTSNGTRD